MTTTQRKCTAPHAALKLDRALWATLELVGVQKVEADETGPAEVYELRNCACGSTLGLKVA